MLIRNPENPAEVFDTEASRKRGRPAKWLVSNPEYLKYREGVEAAKAVEKLRPAARRGRKIEVAIVDEESGLTFWKWRGDPSLGKMTAKCFVAAGSELEAVRELNKVFRFPVSGLELAHFWQRIVPTEFMPKSIGVFQLGSDGWEQREAV